MHDDTVNTLCTTTQRIHYARRHSEYIMHDDTANTLCTTTQRIHYARRHSEYIMHDDTANTLCMTTQRIHYTRRHSEYIRQHSEYIMHDIVECVYRDSRMDLASSVSPMAVSASVSVFQVTGCFPSPRIHRIRISRVMLTAFSWCWVVIELTMDPSLSFSRTIPRSVYCDPTLRMMLMVSPVLVGRLISRGSVGP